MKRLVPFLILFLIFTSCAVPDPKRVRHAEDLPLTMDVELTCFSEAPFDHMTVTATENGKRTFTYEYEGADAEEAEFSFRISEASWKIYAEAFLDGKKVARGFMRERPFMPRKDAAELSINLYASE